MMTVLISTLFRIDDIGSLILIFVVNASMSLFGLVMEQLNSNRTDGKTDWGAVRLRLYCRHSSLGCYMLGTVNRTSKGVSKEGDIYQ